MRDVFRAGQIAMTGAAVQLTAIPSAGDVIFKNLGAADMYFKENSTVDATNGFPLGPGDAITLTVLNPRKIYVLGTSTQRLAWATVSGQ